MKRDRMSVLLSPSDEPDEAESALGAGAVDVVPPRGRGDRRLPDGGTLRRVQAPPPERLAGGRAAAGVQPGGGSP